MLLTTMKLLTTSAVFLLVCVFIPPASASSPAVSFSIPEDISTPLQGTSDGSSYGSSESTESMSKTAGMDLSTTVEYSTVSTNDSDSSTNSTNPSETTPDMTSAEPTNSTMESDTPSASTADVNTSPSITTTSQSASVTTQSSSTASQESTSGEISADETTTPEQETITLPASEGVPLVVIIGGAVGGVAALVAAVLLVCLLLRRGSMFRRRRNVSGRGRKGDDSSETANKSCRLHSHSRRSQHQPHSLPLEDFPRPQSSRPNPYVIADVIPPSNGAGDATSGRSSEFIYTDYDRPGENASSTGGRRNRGDVYSQVTKKTAPSVDEEKRDSGSSYAGYDYLGGKKKDSDHGSHGNNLYGHLGQVGATPAGEDEECDYNHLSRDQHRHVINDNVYDTACFPTSSGQGDDNVYNTAFVTGKGRVDVIDSPYDVTN